MKKRAVAAEKLDNLLLAGYPLHQALKSLAWINRWFGNHRAVVNCIVRISKKEKRPLKIIDLGCGGGDLIRQVAASLQKNNIPFSITGIDGNDNSLQYAQRTCAGFSGINFLQADILNPGFKIEPCDVLMSSHFMYHFTEDGLVHFLNNNLGNISTALLCSELERNPFALLLFKCSSFLLPISRLAKEDGLLAIKRAFTKKEWLDILQKADITVFRIKRVPVFRILLIISPQKKY